MKQSAFILTVNSKGIAEIVFDLPDRKVNVLSGEVYAELWPLLKTVAADRGVRALVFKSGKPSSFIAGADLTKFPELFHDQAAADAMIVSGHEIIAFIAALPFPTIAAIHGVCVGGGLEFALGCRYRIVSDHPSTSLGLPEVTLGIFPGWGGTQRLPRLVGLQKGVQMILSGAPVDAKGAVKIGLADEIAAWEFFEARVADFSERCAVGKKPGKKIGKASRWLLESNPLGRALFFWQAKRLLLRKTKGHYLAPLAALRLIARSFPLSLERGLDEERRAFVQAMSRDFQQAPNLIGLFFAQEEVKKNPGLPDPAAVPKKVETVGVIGAGTMGSAIAWLFSYRGKRVRFKDISWEMIGKGYAHAWGIYQTLISLRKLKPNEAILGFQRLSGTVDYTGLDQADLVIEAAVENLELKKRLLQELEPRLSKDAVIATNTSSLTVAELATVLKHPERLVGMHFFNPPNRMPLVEVVRGEQTSDETVATAVDVCRQLKKTAIVVHDCPGFLVNRVFALGMNEVLSMVQEGISMPFIGAAVLDFGMPMDPFLLADQIGNDVNYMALKRFEKVYGERMAVPEILQKIYDHKLFGKKVGKGFYCYEGKKIVPNSLIEQFVQGQKVLCSKEEILDRMLLAMVNEAARCLEQQVVPTAAHIDIALVMGVGFPPFRGGLLRFADQYGISRVQAALKQFAERFGERFDPCPLINEMASKNQNFYEKSYGER